MHKLLMGVFVLILSTSVQAAELKGSFTQGGMVIGKTKENTIVYVNSKKLRVTPGGVFVFGFGRDDKTEHELKEVFADGTELVSPITITAREYDIQKIEGVEQKYVTPPESRLKRIREEGAKVKAARNTDSDFEWFTQNFIMPAEGPISGVYGSQRYFNGTPKRPHFGLDIAGPVGTDIIAPADGVVTLAEPDLYYSGGTLILDHGYGISSTFIHLSALVVNNGDVVKKGQLIAKMGKSGRVTGPHLDWRINWYQERLDPQLLIAPK